MTQTPSPQADSPKSKGPGALIGSLRRGPFIGGNLPFDLSDGVSLRALPPWLAVRERNPFAGTLDGRDLLNCDFCLYVETPGPLHDGNGRIDPGAFDAGKKLRDAALALWVGSRSSLEIATTAICATSSVSRELCCELVIQQRTLNLKTLAPGIAFIGVADLADAKILYRAFERATGPLRTALDLFVTAAGAEFVEVAYVLVWCALEALFAPSGAEATYKLRLRMSLFLADSEKEAGDLFKKSKEWYDERSEMVHGRSFGPKDKDHRAKRNKCMDEVENALRGTLKRIARSESLMTVFSSAKRRNEALDALVFSHRSWPVGGPSLDDAE